VDVLYNPFKDDHLVQLAKPVSFALMTDTLAVHVEAIVLIRPCLSRLSTGRILAEWFFFFLCDNGVLPQGLPLARQVLLLLESLHQSLAEFSWVALRELLVTCPDFGV
jgi:hypothetical protein